MARSVRIWYRKHLRLSTLTLQQRDMVEIGSKGLLDVKRRLREALGPDDNPAKPLTKSYARYKSKLLRGNRRDLWLTGKMLGNLSLRTVNRTMAKAALTSNKQRIKGRVNTQREPWLVYSPKNVENILIIARKVFTRTTSQILQWSSRRNG